MTILVSFVLINGSYLNSDIYFGDILSFSIKNFFLFVCGCVLRQEFKLLIL